MTLTALNAPRTARRLITFATTFATTFALVSLLTACKGGQPGDVSFDAIAGDLTPSLAGSFQRPIDVDGDIAITNNLNWRLFSDDLGRTFYTDHPSRLSPIPIVYTSGMPR